MNINQRISELGPGGLPRYNKKCNELTRAVNWLLGMTTSNGKVISDGGRGPVIQTGGGPVAGAQPWATDPDGNPAGWLKITHLDLDGSITGFTNSMYQLWTWVGIPPSPPGISSKPIPWMVDPSNNEAGWIVCADNTFWGTGRCSTGPTCTNFQNAHYTGSDSGNSPLIVTANPSASPITPPSSCNPRFYLVAITSTDLKHPVLSVVNGLGAGDPSSASFNWTFTVTYDGTTVLSASGTDTAISGQATLINLPTAGWLFDPGGIPGYSQGRQDWIYPFDGAVSANTNPPVVQTFTFQFVKLTMGYQELNVVFMTG